VTTVDQPLESGPPVFTGPKRPPRWITGWGPSVVSLAAALSYGLFVAFGTYEVDLGVYLRLGGRYIFTPHLYSLALPNTELPFTYPPFAALLFAPWQRVFGTAHPVQTVWTIGNLAALIALLVLSLRIIKPEMDRKAALRLGLLLSLPALLLNPVVITVDFGQVNLVVTLLVVWDLLSQRRIGSWQAPLGVATGLAAAVKLTPILFVPYLILTRRTRGAVTCVATFVVCELMTFLLSPTSSRAYWTHALFTPGRAGNLSYVGDQNLMAAVERLQHGLVTNLALLPVLATVAAGGLWLAALAHRRSSPMLGLLICAATGLLVSPISWAHHMVWVIPAILWLGLGEDRPRFGVPLAIGSAVLFWIAPIWWVPHVSASDLHLNAWQLVAGNSFFFAVLLFVLGAAVLLTRRRSIRQSNGGQLLSGGG
jgi:alpha-1,2-mannosyltransferase